MVTSIARGVILMFILFCCRWSTKDKCYQHLLIYTNKLVLAGGFGPPKARGAGDLQSPGIDHYPKLAYQKLL